MTRNTKRLLALLLALLLCVSLLPAAAMAEDEDTGTIEPAGDDAPGIPTDDPEAMPPMDESNEVYSGQCGDNLTWTLTDDDVLTITGTGDMWESSWVGDAPWYEYHESIKAVELPKGLTSIGVNAFVNCNALTSITIPEGVTSIGANAFGNCSALTSVTIPESVTDIGGYTTIDSNTRDYGAFEGCSLLKTAGPNDGDYNIRFGWTESVPSCAFFGCSYLTSITIPASMTSIEAKVFYNCSALTSVTIPASVTSIGYGAFSGCSALESVIIPASVTSIGHGAFLGCSSLKSVTIPECVTSIEESTFSGCSALTSVTIPASVTSIGYSAFRGCRSLKSVTIPEGVTCIKESTFSGCSSLSSVMIPSSVTSIEKSAFSDCYLLKTAGPLDGDYNIRLGWTESVPSSAFFSCSYLTSMTIPEGVTSIGGEAFRNCTRLTSVTIPTSVRVINSWAFSGCSALTSVYYEGYEEIAARYKGNGWSTSSNGALFNATWYFGKTLEEGWALCGDDLIWHYHSDTRSITVKGSGSMWDFGINSQPWVEYMGKLAGVNFEPGITNIGTYAFCGCDRLRNIKIPAGVTNVGNYAFSGCKGLTDVTIPGSVKTIGVGVFDNCALTTVKIPENVTGIGSRAFSQNIYLNSIFFLGASPDIKSDSFTGVTANAYYPNDGSWWEDDFQDYGGNLTWIAVRNPVTVSGKSLTLNGKIELNFYLDLADGLLQDENAYVTVNDVKYLVKDAELCEVRSGESGYRFTVQVKFAQLTDEWILRAFDGEDRPATLLDIQGNDLTETGLVYRAQDYIEYIRSDPNSSTGLLAVVNALSDLGSLAQAQFDYKVDNRVQVVGELDAVTANVLAPYAPTVSTAGDSGVRYYGSSLLLQDVTTIRHYFKVPGGNIGDYTFTVEGIEVTPLKKGIYYYIDIPGIVARDLDKSFRVQVSSADGEIISLDYCAMSYVYKLLSRDKPSVLTDLAKAVYLYGDAADAYFPD